MNVRATAVQGTLAVVGLAAAWLTWQRPPQSDSSGKVTVVSATKAALERVRYERKDQWLELARDSSGAENRFWIQRGIVAPPPAPEPDGGVADGGRPPAAPAPNFKPGEYKAGERAAQLHEKLAPLVAVRTLGKLGDDKLKELGLEPGEKRLELTVSGSKRSFKVAPSEGGGTYLLDQSDGQVYVVSSGTLSDFDAPDVLVDRRLHAFERNELDGFAVALGGKSKAFVQKPGESALVPGPVSPADKPDQPDEQVRNWHQKVWTRVSATKVLPKGEKPGEAEPELALRIDYTWQGKPKGWLEIAKARSGEVFARSENTAGWVQVAAIDDVLTEAAKIVGG